MNIDDKKNIILSRIDNMNVHIDILESDILDNPGLDVEGKTPRSEVLNNYISIKSALIKELEALDSKL